MAQLQPPIEAIVFDLDDTLYPERSYVRSGFRAVAEHLAASAGVAAEEVFARLWATFEAGPRDRVFNHVLAELGLGCDEAVISDLVRCYRDHPPELRLNDAVRALLGRLRRRCKLGLLSDGFLPAQQLKVAALGLDDAFDAVVFTEALGREHWKPSPRGFELIARQLAVAPERCVYVADNPRKDFVAPNALGWQSVQICGPEQVHPPGHDLTPPGGRARAVIATILELEALLPAP